MLGFYPLQLPQNPVASVEQLLLEPCVILASILQYLVHAAMLSTFWTPFTARSHREDLSNIETTFTDHILTCHM